MSRCRRPKDATGCLLQPSPPGTPSRGLAAEGCARRR
jgi:hypothetical protein